MKYFLGVTPAGLADNARLKQVLSKIKRTVCDWGDPVRWTPPAMWHVTVLFLGAHSPEERDRTVRLLDEWSPSAKTELSLHGMGAFPSAESGRVLWLGVRKNQAFLDLQKSLEQAFLAEGLLKQPDEEFRPHLTLVRFRHTRHVQSLLSLAGKTDFGDYPVEELVLYESVMEGQMPKYIPRHVKKL